MYFAIITKGLDETESTKRWAMTSTNKDAVIRQAIDERRKSEAQGYGPYRILVGRFETEIVTSNDYKEVRLKKGKR